MARRYNRQIEFSTPGECQELEAKSRAGRLSRVEARRYCEIYGVQHVTGFGAVNTDIVSPPIDSFDFAGDMLSRGAGLTGASDSKSGILSAWFRLDASDGSNLYMFNGHTTLGGDQSTARFTLFRAGTFNELKLIGGNASGTTILSLNCGAFTAGAAWHHFLASWDLSVPRAEVYLDDVAKTVVTATNDTLDYTLADWTIGGSSDISFLYDGCLADLYFAAGQYLPLYVTNRRKFRTASGKPAYLGALAILPTGKEPSVFHHLVDGGNPISTKPTGTGGSGTDWQAVGALATGSTSPSD